MAHISAIAPRTALRAQKWSFVGTLVRLNELSRQRDALRKLDANRLRDLGLTQSEIDEELSQPIWTRL